MNTNKKIAQTNSKTNKKHSIKPQAAFYFKCGVYILVKDENSKRHFKPLSAKQKDAHYPMIDTLRPKAMGKLLDLEKGKNFFNLDDSKTWTKHLKELSHTSQRKRGCACSSLIELISSLKNRRTAYIVFLISLLARVRTFISKDTLSITPHVYCEDLSEIPLYLRTVLSVVNGAEKIKGTHFELLRPSCLEYNYVCPGSPELSSSIHAYLGGTADIDGRRRNFWLPLWNRAVCVSPQFPSSMESKALSPCGCIPFYCGKVHKSADTHNIYLDGNELLHVDVDKLKSLQEPLHLLSIIVEAFVREITSKPDYVNSVFCLYDNYLSPKHIGSFAVTNPTFETCVLVAALCVYRAFLSFVKRYDWISDSQLDNYLFDAENTVFPPLSNNPFITPAGEWNSSEVFWAFLESFLSSHRDLIYYGPSPYSVDSIAAVYTVEGENSPRLILPRKVIAAEYKKYCIQNNFSISWSETTLNQEMQKWPIDLKHEKNSASGWSYNFYAKNQLPADISSPRVRCLAIPLTLLPASIQPILDRLPC